MRQRRLEIAIATVPRGVSYIHRTIRDLCECGVLNAPGRGQLRLVVGSRDSSHLNRYEQDTRFRIEYLSDAEADLCDRLEVREQRIALNMARALSSCKDTDYLLVLEDDIRFSSGWLPRMQQTLDEVEDAYGRSWVLTLYYPSIEPKRRYGIGEKWYVADSIRFFGTLAVAYPPELAQSFAGFLHERCISRYSLAPDLLLGVFVREQKLPFLATAPCLVQHVGRVSTFVGEGHRFFQTKGFSRSV